MSDLYGTGGTLFESNSIPEGLLDPDAPYFKWWDLFQYVALIYIVFLIPLRIGFARQCHKQC